MARAPQKHPTTKRVPHRTQRARSTVMFDPGPTRGRRPQALASAGRSATDPSTPFRIGFGYDIHRLAPGKGVTLGGVRIASTTRLVGHSDADVLLHAICDALLGAAALGDIGKHFPNTDPKYRGISSLRLLEAAKHAVAREGYDVVNVDATVILERPKIGPATARMQSRIGRVLGLPPSAVSVKATTNESLGPLGRGEGCAAMAVALIVRR